MWRQIGAHDVMQCKGRPNSKGDPRLVDWWGARALMKNSHKKKRTDEEYGKNDDAGVKQPNSGHDLTIAFVILTL